MEEVEVENLRLIVPINPEEFDDVLALFEGEENPLPPTTVPDHLIPFLKENCEGEEEILLLFFFSYPTALKFSFVRILGFPNLILWTTGTSLSHSPRSEFWRRRIT